jgi:hypothetical protein
MCSVQVGRFAGLTSDDVRGWGTSSGDKGGLMDHLVGTLLDFGPGRQRGTGRFWRLWLAWMLVDAGKHRWRGRKGRDGGGWEGRKKIIKRRLGRAGVGRWAVGSGR